MSEQDKEMESAAEKYASENPRNEAQDFKAGWKAASERKDSYKDMTIERLTRALDGHRLTRNEYMDEIVDLQSKLATALEALEFYADIENISWAQTGRGKIYLLEGVNENEPMKTLLGEYDECGKRAREALARIKGDAK